MDALILTRNKLEMHSMNKNAQYNLDWETEKNKKLGSG